MNLPLARPGEVDHPAFDKFALVHGLAGIIMERFGARLPTALGLAIGWELLEDAVNATLPSALPYRTRETFDNKVGDVVSTMAGWALSRLASTQVRGKR